MQTSKSYGGTVNNIEVKLELDDLEYVLADEHNLIINSEDVTEEADENNIVYTDGSQTVVLQTGVKHYIQTLAGETYFLGNDRDNIQHLVINAEDQSEESNSTVEYVQNDENGETIIYELADTENEIDDGQPKAKRFKIGGMEFLTLDDTTENLQQDDSNQFSILDESSISENSNFQYAILDDGKLHLKICDPNSIEVFNDPLEHVENSEPGTEHQEETEEYEDDNDKIQEYVLVNTDISENAPGGKTMTLDEYLNEIKDIEHLQDMQSNGGTNDFNDESYSQYLNKKLLIRKNDKGKSLFGKILHIESARKEDEDEKKDIQTDDTQECLDNEIIGVNQNEISLVKEQYQNGNEEAAIENDIQELVCDDPEQIVSVENDGAIEYNREVTEEHLNFICKTLHGIVDMPSLKRKLVNNLLEIKLVQKVMNDETQELVKDVRYISGMLRLHDKGFGLHTSTGIRNTTSLTIILCQDMNNQKVTKVIFHEKHANTCELCNESFESVSQLNKHVQQNHVQRTVSCNVCQEKFENPALLTEHRKTHNVKNLECVICKARFTKVSHLSKHLVKHAKVKVYGCDACTKSFMNYEDLTRHKKVHAPTKSCYCGICGREFSRHSNMLRHAEIHKGNGDLYKCGICDCSYKFISSLTRHIVQNHMKQAN